MTRGHSLLLAHPAPSPLRRTQLRSFAPRPIASLLLLLAAGVLAVGALSPQAHAQTAGTWNRRGEQAELHQDYDAAYEDYLHAHQKKPGDLRYTERVDRMRFQASIAHVDRGRVLRQSGDIAGALTEFTRALQIDPGDEVAAQEIQITRHPEAISPTGPGSAAIVPGAPGADPGAAAAAVSNGSSALPPATLQDLGLLSGPTILRPVSNDPITLNLVEDTKAIYMAIGKAAGLNVLFDPDYTSKRIPVVLTSVSLYDALRIVGAIAGTFYKPVTPNTIYVAQNNRAKHNDLDDLAVQTFFITNDSQPNDGNEIQQALRNVLPAETKIFFAAGQNAMIVRGTPDQLLLAGKIISDLDRPKSEVVVDVAILQVNRDKIRNLGITLPQSFGLTPQASSTSTTSSTGSTSTSSTTSSTTSGFTLNTLANLNATNFAVTLGGGTLNALLSDADTRVLQNPSLRSTDGQRATLTIGSKIPIATGSYSAGAATGITAGIGVQTQFQFIDVGVTIDMTPTIHLNREISLKMKVVNSSQTSSVTISGVTEPIIASDTVEHTIQLHEGEPSILAGILTKTDTATNSGTPGLAQIPILKYLFGSQYKEVQQSEIVFVLIPHIVREAVLTRANTRAIDTGTSADIQLRHDPSLNPAADEALLNRGAKAPGVPTTAANAATAVVQQMKQQALPPTRPAAVPTTPAPLPSPISAPAGPPVTYTLVPVSPNQTVGGTFQVAILGANANDLASTPLQLQYDPKVLQLVTVDAGRLLAADGQQVAFDHTDQGNGLVAITATRPPGTQGVNGQGDLCTLTFKAIAPGDARLALVKVGAFDSRQATLRATGSQALIHVTQAVSKLP